MPYTRAQLAQAFSRAGFAPGDNVIVHSSFKSIGPVEGGPASVVGAILDVIGKEGHLMVPTFTYAFPMWNVEPFDIRNSRSRTGIIPETVRLWPEAKRSFHPTHSVAVIGPGAEDLIRNHLHATPIGLDSPFGRMCQRKAKILMLGTHQDTNSSLHYCEVLAKLPYIHVPFSENQNYEIGWFLNETGQIEYTQLYEVPGCSRGFRAVEQPLIDRNVLRFVKIGQAESQMLDLPALADAMIEIFAEDPTILLCRTANCTICPKRRAAMEKLRQ